jgi:HK97 family phage major capsid protein
MNPLTYAAFKAVQNGANYNVDIFEGLEVAFSDALPAYATASEDDVYAIVGDFGYGARAVVPDGDDVQIKIDDKTLMEEDLVRILGRKYIGVAPVACKAFALISKPATV